jgi:hypothetical protein
VELVIPVTEKRMAEQIEGEVVRTSDYYMEHADEFDALSQEDKDLLIANGELSIKDPAEDTAKADDPAKDPDPAKDDTDPAKKAPDPDPADVKPDGILAKDGKNIIPYDRLVEAQTEAATLRQQTADQQKLIDELKKAVAKDEDNGGTEAQDAVMAELKEGYPDLAKLLEPVITNLVERGVKATVSNLQEKFETTIKPLKESVDRTAADEHFEAIREKHSDFDDLMDSKVVDAWIEKQPAFLRGTYQQVMKAGNTQEVIELVQAYKDANPAPKPADTAKPAPTVDVVKEAKGIVDKATKDTAPASMSDIPAGGGAVVDENAAYADLSGAQALQKFEGKTPAQIEEILNKLL